MFVWALQLLVREDHQKSWLLGIYQNCRAGVTPVGWVDAGPSVFAQASSLLWEPLFDCGSEASR